MKKRKNYFLVIFFIAIFAFVGNFSIADIKKSDIIYSDPDYIIVKSEPKENNYILKIESKNIGAVDWIGFISRLELGEFDSENEFYDKIKNNRTAYTSEEKVVGVVWVNAKSFFRYFDLLSHAIDWAVNRVFGESTNTTVPVPSDQENIYLIRAYSGGWGKLIDSEEKSFIKKNFYRGDGRDTEAVALNLGIAAIDTLGIFISYTDIRPTDLNKIAEAGLLEASKTLVYTTLNRETSPTLQDLFHTVIESGKAMVEKTAEVTKKDLPEENLKRFIKRFKLAADLVNVPQKISKGGKVVDRIVQMISVTTPLETSYIVIGNPLLTLGKEETKKVSEITKKVGPAALVSPSPTPIIKKQPTAPSPAKQISRITGFVKDQYNEPVENTKFWLIDEEGKEYGRGYGYTSQTGYLEIDTKSIPEGNYTLHIEGEGFDGIHRIPYHDPYEKKITISKQDISLGILVVNKWSKIIAKILCERFDVVSYSFDVIDEEWHSTAYYPKYPSHYGYAECGGRLESLPLPDGIYTFKIGGVEKKINIAGSDINLGELVIPKQSQ